jgi:hypothetical protein
MESRMSAPRPKRNLVIGAAVVAVAACSQNPQFRMTSANQAYSSLNELYVLLSKAELGALRSASTFDDSADSYATAMAGFQLGRLLDTDGPIDIGPSGSALQVAIARCVDQIKRMSVLHRTRGIEPASPAIDAVRRSCDAAAGSIAATETSSWLFATAAGDL